LGKTDFKTGNGKGAMRISQLQRNSFNDMQKRFCENLVAGKRGASGSVEPFFTPEGILRGPFNAWLHSPVIGDAAQRLGETIRFEGSLFPRHRELAILTMASHWKAEYEFWAHEKIARREGVEESLIQSLSSGVRPDFVHVTDALVYDFSREVICERKVSDSLFNDAICQLGEAGVVDLVLLLGYYTLVSMTLNVFHVRVPEGE
jgi:4-carboxymuconolactone decarboxylase